MYRKFLILFTSILLTGFLDAKGFSTDQLNSTGKEFDSVDHSIWDKLLKMYVADNGDVNYKGFKMDAETLNSYIDYLASKVPSENWSKNEKLAYYINIYNSYTVKLIIDNLPIKGIKDISNPWSKNRIKIAGKSFSLSDIENNILRKMGEPRIHFAINCASKSCPKLLNLAYTSENIDSLLEQTAKGFINNPNKNKISESSLQLSKIFKWYKEDFTKNGTLIDYLNRYSKIKIHPNATVTYLDYDWGLNEQE